VEKSTEYVKGRSARALSRILGQGLITSGGELWRRQRTMTQPAFQRDFLSGLVGKMTASVNSMLSGWPAKQADIAIDGFFATI
jgi:cytochrome P450